jgi:hypothetical protein
MKSVLSSVRNRFRKLKVTLFRKFYQKQIDEKWTRDKGCLPLNNAQRELYEIIHWNSLLELGEFPELINCRDLNDKINWLKLFDQSEIMVRCSDKLLLRDYVRERIGDRYLLELYQVHDHFAEIDIDALPRSFVIKTNHDSGTVILVRDQATFGWGAAEKRVEQSLKEPYGWLKGEWAYSFITPKVFVEALVDPASDSPVADYKFMCSEGRAKICCYISDRGVDTKEQLVDIQGNDLKTGLSQAYKYGSGFIKPAAWDEMIWVAEQLARGFKFVRIDLYFSRGRIYVGEMTFWPMAGVFDGEARKTIDKYFDFDRSTYKPHIIPQLTERHPEMRGLHTPVQADIDIACQVNNSGPIHSN